MAQIPTPLRAALGLVASAIDGARTLPDKALELPVIAVSTALQISLRAQQRYAELTMRGDEVIGRLHGLPEEAPPWATFDDEAAGEQPGDTQPVDDVDEPPASIEIVTQDDTSLTAPQPMRSAEKRPRPRRSSATGGTATDSPATERAARSRGKTLRARRAAEPSAFDAVGDSETRPAEHPDIPEV